MRNGILFKSSYYRTLVLAGLLCAFAVAGCGHRRVAPFAPRRPDTPDHRAAKTSADCIECHTPAKIKDHAPGDKCVSCHFRIPGR